MGLWDVGLDAAKANFVNGLEYAKSRKLYWHGSGDFYPYPPAAWRLDPLTDPDNFSNFKITTEYLYNEVRGDLEQLTARNVSNPVWHAASGNYYNAVKLTTGTADKIREETQKCRDAFIAGTLDQAGFDECKARVAEKHGV